MAWRQLSEARWGHVRQVLPPVKPSRKGGRPRADRPKLRWNECFIEAASPRRKKGRQNRPDQAREGHKVDGTRRWRGYSAGSIPGRGVPGGGSWSTRHWPAEGRPARLIADRGVSELARRDDGARRGIVGRGEWVKKGLASPTFSQ
jgi:hypothetical protein